MKIIKPTSLRTLRLLILLALSTLQTVAQESQEERVLKAQTYYYQGVLEAKQERWSEALSLLRYSYHLDSTSVETAFELGRAELAMNHISEGIAYLRLAYEADRGSRLYVENLMSALQSASRSSEAVEIGVAWVKAHPEDEFIAMRLAHSYLASGEVDKAVDVYSMLQKAQGKNIQSFMRFAYAKARVYLMSSRIDSALAQYREVVDAFPYDLEAKAQYASALIEHKRPEQVSSLLTELRRDGYEITPLTLLELAYYSTTQRPDSAVQVLKRIETEGLIPAGEQIEIWRSFLQEQRGKTLLLPHSYNHYIDSLLVRHPDDLALALGYGTILRQQGLYPRAIEVLRPFLTDNPTHEELWEGIIGDAVSAENNELASGLSRQAIRHIKTNWKYYLYACIGLMERPEEALAIAEQGIRELPQEEKWGRSVLYGVLGDIHLERGHQAKSFASYDKALELEPNNASVLNNYAYALVERGIDLDKAEQMAGNAVRLQPKDVNALDTFAWIYYKQGKYRMARLYQTEAMTLAGDDASAVLYDHLGDIRMALEEIDGAREAWIQAQELYLKDGKVDKAKAVGDKIKGKTKPMVKSPKKKDK